MAPFTVCLTGPECTGKTQLATEMAARFGTVYVPEFARQYALANPRPLGEGDVEAIARGQIAITDAIARDAGWLLLLDTDLISTVVYARHYYGHCPEWIVEEAKGRRANRYLLLDVDTPWEPDGVRDDGQDRATLFGDFARALDEFSVPWTVVTGSWDVRREQVLGVLRSLVG